jgi:hypothetical protein
MQQATVQIVGTIPLLMHNVRLANPLDRFAKEIKTLTSKRIKTEDDHLQIAKLEFLGGLYYDTKIGPYIPGGNILASIRDGGKIIRKGTAIKRGLFVAEDKVRLDYTGPREPEVMFDSGFADIRGVSGQGTRGGSVTMRCRPIFNPPWKCAFTLMFDETVISPDDLRQCVEIAGRLTGLCDYVPRFGKYEVAEWTAG